MHNLSVVDYEHTSYIAEFYNTISNIPMILLGLFGLYHAFKSRLDYRFNLSFFFLFFIGIGSSLFHATLLYHFQLLDELPMILGSLVFIYCMVDMQLVSLLENNPKKHHITSLRWILTFFLTAYGIITGILMALYVNRFDLNLINSNITSPLPMNISYVAMVVFMTFRAVAIVYHSKDENIRTYFWVSLFFFMSGAIFWVI
jgi:hypothetical protein